MITGKYEITNYETNETTESIMYVFDEDEQIDWGAMGVVTEETFAGYTVEELLISNSLEDIEEAINNPDCILLYNPDNFEELKRKTLENLYEFEMYVWWANQLLPQPTKKTVDTINHEVDFFIAWDDTISNHLLMETLDWSELCKYHEVDTYLHSCDSPYTL